MPESLRESLELGNDHVLARELEDRWPELFTGLSPTQRHDVASRLLAEWCAGLPITYDVVLALTDEKRGFIEPPEYL